MPSPWIFQAWQNYYSLTGEAAATLIGLMFVALTFAEGVIQGETAKIFRIWVEPTLYNFIQALAISVIAEMPLLPLWIFGWIVLLNTGYRLLRWWEVLASFKGPEAPGDLDRDDWLDQVVFPGLSFILAFVSAVGLLLEAAWAPLGLALYVFMLLMLGIKNTWTQFAWTAGEKVKRRRQ
jgi:hypothetical protein